MIIFKNLIFRIDIFKTNPFVLLLVRDAKWKRHPGKLSACVRVCLCACISMVKLCQLMRGNNGRVSVNDDDVSTNDGKMSLGK